MTSPEAIRRILEHLELPARAPPLAPARLADDEWDSRWLEGKRQS